MQRPRLVIMAAGLGSRYGGLKQIAPVDDLGHIIIDFSLFDARRAGFEDVTFIVKPELERDFRLTIGDRVSAHMRIEYARQALDMLPDGFAIPAGRVKPWGTGHAVLCAASQIDGPFAVINADDYYGPSAFQAIFDFLMCDGAENAHAMVGYRLENTLSENGTVARGVCQTDADGYLTEIVERTSIAPRPGGAAFTEDGEHFHFLPGETVVSMNLWGFRRSILNAFRTQFVDFLRETLPGNARKAEYYLPSVPGRLIQTGSASVRVLPTAEKWFGVTYPQDMKTVRAAIAEKKAAGLYPERLWK